MIRARRTKAQAEHQLHPDLAIGDLDDLTLDQLRKHWHAVTGSEAPKAFRRRLLIRALAYEMQVARYGDLSPALKRRLRHLADAARDSRFTKMLGGSSIKPGTLLIREWNGETHRVMSTKDGFVWHDKSYSSLSAIARDITGTAWNGWVFFGIRKRPERNKNAAKTTEAVNA